VGCIDQGDSEQKSFAIVPDCSQRRPDISPESNVSAQRRREGQQGRTGVNVLKLFFFVTDNEVK
jgi:hypothetical protein